MKNKLNELITTGNEKIKLFTKKVKEFSEIFNHEDKDYMSYVDTLEKEIETLKMANDNLITENLKLKDEMKKYNEVLKETLETLKRI